MEKKMIIACTSLLIALIASLGSVLAENENESTNAGMKWDGMYATSIRDNGSKGQWSSPNTLLVTWGRDLQYNGTSISGAKFFNNSSISWTDDPVLGKGQLWFASGDNRSFYWPDGAVTGKVFTGKAQAISGKIIDFRGLNETILSNETNVGVGCIGASCPNETKSCGPCSNGKVCSDGQCVCPSGTTDCFGQCLTEAPCGGGCANDKACIDGKCICPDGTKECNDRCIKVTECCDVCTVGKVCDNGRCICPPGGFCPDSL